ncbi:MAG: dsbA 1 [Gammaproteobacteria bacterium]|nr:dsbA 1 [Gammaproteobacteria bacterium]
MLASTIAFSDTSLSNTMSPAQEKQIETAVHDFIIKNPEVVIQSLQGYQQKQMADQTKKFEQIQKNTPKYANQLFHEAADPIGGNPNGAVTLVEFFDYQCPHCIDMTATIEKIVKTNPNLKIVLKEFPIRGAMSELATRAALAAQKQGKYFELHTALMGSKIEPLTENTIYDLARSAGLNVDKLKVDMKDKSVDQQIKTNYQLAKDLQIMFTPVLFIAKSNVTPNAKTTEIAFIPGQISSEQLTDILKKIGG